MTGPTQLALDSNAIATAAEDGNKRAVRRMLLTDKRFRSRSKIEAVEVALETAANMIAVNVIGEDANGSSAAGQAIAQIRTLIDCLHDAD